MCTHLSRSYFPTWWFVSAKRILLSISWCFNKHYQSHPQGVFNSVYFAYGAGTRCYTCNVLTPLVLWLSIACSRWRCRMSLRERSTHTGPHGSGLLLCAGMKGTLQTKEEELSHLKESQHCTQAKEYQLDYWRMNDSNWTTKRIWFCNCTGWLWVILLFSHFLWVFVHVALRPFLQGKKSKGRLENAATANAGKIEQISGRPRPFQCLFQAGKQR